MPSLADFRAELPHLSRADDETVVRYLHRNYAPQEDFEDFALAFGHTPAPQPLPERSAVAAANDTVIDAANALAGSVGMVADFVAPGNPVSPWINANIVDPGKALQSDRKKAIEQRFQEELQAAETLGDEALAAGRYAAADPLGILGQGLGYLVPAFGAVRGASMLGRLAGLGAQGAVRAGTAGGAAAGGVMSGGDAAGQAYAEARQAGATDEQARSAARQASILPAIVGAAAGAVGVEPLLAGSKGFAGGMLARLLKTAAAEGGTGAIEEGLTQYEANRAVAPFDGRDPWRGVGAASTLGLMMEAPMGAGASMLTRRPPDEPPPRDEPPPLSETIVQIANAPDADSAIRAMGRALEVRTGPGTAPEAADARWFPKEEPGEPSATLTDMPFGDRLLTLREQIADPRMREAIRARWGDAGMDEITYYAGIADRPGGVDGLPERTRDNLLAVAEQMVRAAVLTPIIQPEQLPGPQVGGMLQLPRPADSGPDDAGSMPAIQAIALDTTPTGVIRVDAAGTAAPETRADQVSTRQRADEAASLGRGVPRGAAPAIRMPGPIPVGEATEVDLLPTGDATEIEPIPVGEAADLIATGEAIEVPRRRIPVGVATELTPEVIDGDLLTADQAPYGTRTGALIRARREGLGPGNVVEVPGAGWVVRPIIEARPAGTRGTAAADVLPAARPGAAEPADAGDAALPTPIAPAHAAAPAADGLGAPAGVAPKPVAPRRDSESWRTEGMSPAQIAVRRAEGLGNDLAAILAEEARANDFAPNDLPRVVAQWAQDQQVPADELRGAVLKALDRYDISDGRKRQIRRALDPTRVPQPAASDTAAKLQARQERKAKVGRDSKTIELRKRLSVLEALKGCLG